MQRIILSLALIVMVAGVLTFGATNAFFSDTESSEGNLFTAGAIDLTVDNESYYNGKLNQNTSWEATDLTVEKFFDFDDVKPNDYGEDTISLHVATNDAYMCANVTLTSNNDNTQTEPESAVDPNGLTEGELADLINFVWWADDGDNVFEKDEEIISQGPIGTLELNVPYNIALADSDENVWTGVGGPVPGNETLYLGKAWCFGEIGTDPVDQDGQANALSPAGDNNENDIDGEPEDGGITCDGTLLGNESQTDSLTADVTFEVVQARHNEDFQCEAPTRTTLTLIKQVLNGDNQPTDWTLSANGPTSFSGITGTPAVTSVEVESGTYDLSESVLGEYVASNWSCSGGDQTDSDTVEIAEGEQVVCKISNFLVCEPEFAYADHVVSHNQGVRKDGGAIALDRTDPDKVLGAPQHPLGLPFDNPVVAGSFFSLGFDEGTDDTPDEGGSIVVEFLDNYIVDGVGNDLKMWEVTGGSSYPVERIKIEVSQNGTNWFEVASNLERDAEADLFDSGLTWARYVRLTDVSNRDLFNNAADGYDLDAFSALNCADRTFIAEN
ncbi:SipW-dependent-type signal peptide-containing protein [Candidatus Kaiserbacteria bacterium]|nr:SipW-dependent-type signal peptide-containing protein [Candidatus Kaiserbacteria bacterium]